MQHKDLGYDAKNVLRINVEGASMKILIFSENKFYKTPILLMPVYMIIQYQIQQIGRDLPGM